MICNTCGEEKSIDEFYKYHLKCKKCRCKETSLWRKNNKEKVSLARKKNRLENLELHRQKDKEKRNKNPEAFRNRVKRYKEKYPERCRTATKKWQLNNKEKVREWRKKNRGKCLEYTYRWREKNPEKAIRGIRKAAQVQREKFPEKNRARKMVFSAIRIGFMVRPGECSRCLMKSKVDAHHPDYTKPLEVIWLCRQCHNKEHGA